MGDKKEIFSSNHNPILYNITKYQSNISSTRPIRNTNLNIVDFEQVNELLYTFSENVMSKPAPIDSSLGSFYSFIESHLLRLAKHKTYPNRPNWWTHKVERMHKIYLAKKKLLYTNRFQDQRDYLYNEVINAKNNYKSVMHEAQNFSWKQFVENDLEVNPWGVVYKLATERFRRKGVLTSFQIDEQNYTKNASESLSYLLFSLLPDSDETSLHPQQRADTVEYAALAPLEVDLLDPPSQEDIDAIISRISTNKAPGDDLLKGKFLKSTYPIIRNYLHRIYTACFRFAYFPSRWKNGSLIVLLKNPTVLLLLSEYGKILEKLIRKHLQNSIPRLHSPRQYGFITGLSTLNALQDYINYITE